MRPRALTILAAVTVLAVLAAVFVVANAPRTAPPRAGAALYPGLIDRVNEVRRIEIVRTERTFAIERAGEGWAMTDRAGYPVRFEKVKAALVALAEMTTVEAATRKPEWYDRIEVGDAGPDSTGGQITLKDGDGAVMASLILGARAYSRGTANEQMYVRKAGEEQAWLVKGIVDPGRRAVDWLEREIVDLSRERVAEARLFPEGEDPIVVRKTPGETTKFDLASLPEGREVRAPIDVWSIGGLLEKVELHDVARADAVGMGDDISPAAEVRTADGLVVVVRLATRGEESWASFAASATAGASAEIRAEAETLNARLGGWAYQLQGPVKSRLRTKLEDLLEAPKSS